MGEVTALPAYATFWQNPKRKFAFQRCFYKPFTGDISEFRKRKIGTNITLLNSNLPSPGDEVGNVEFARGIGIDGRAARFRAASEHAYGQMALAP